MVRCSSKSGELRNIKLHRMYSEEHRHLKWKIDNFRIKTLMFIVNFGRNNIIRNGQMQVQIEASVSEVLTLVGTLKGIFD